MAAIRTPIPNLKLNDGNSIPMLAFGTGTKWFKSGDNDKFDRTLVDTIKKAIEFDFRHLDGAEVYNTEGELGTAIKESQVDRNKFFVTTKTLKGDDLSAVLKASLEKLQLDYVDLYLLHSPSFAKSDTDLQNAWAEMEQLKAQGLTKSIGVSNFLPNHLEVIRKTGTIPPAVNQIEWHAYLQSPGLLDYHKAHQIATSAYGPLTPVAKAAPGPVDDYVAALSKKYAVNPSEILIRWCIDQDVIPITTSSKEQRISDYLRAATFKLTPVEIKKISELGQEKHFRGFFAKEFSEYDRS